MMRSIILSVATIGLLLFQFVLTAQTNSNLILKTRIVNNKAVVRWLPGDYNTWRSGMENGYRIHVTKTNKIDSTAISYLLNDTIYPQPEGTWNNPDQDEFIDLAHALCYDFSQPIYQGPQGAFTAEEDRNNRFNFMLLTADMSLAAAWRMGLAYEEEDIESGFTYEYKVFLLDTELQSSVSSVDLDSIPPLPVPAGVDIDFGKEEFYLSWEKANLLEYYTSYTIEYSEDEGVTFHAMNNKPFVYFENDEIATALQQRMTYGDSISADVPEYQFRIIGHTPFEEDGPPSEIVSGRSVPDPILVFPQITEVLELADSSFRISWTINEEVVDSVVGINLLRYVEFPGGEATLLTPDALSPDIRTFTDIDPLQVNYYVVEVLDIYGYRHTSSGVLGQLTDSIPPLIPIGLTGTIDSLSDSTMLVQISWSPNQEDDLAGYYIYRANNPDNEFTHLTTSGYITDTLFTDILISVVLSDAIYYRIKSVDFNGNISGFSEIVTIERPDFVPPAPPVLGLVADDNGLEWMNSSSRDVVNYRIERRNYSSPGEWSSLGVRAKSNNTADFIPKSEMSKDGIFVYRVIAIDDAGLESFSNEVVVRPSPLEKTAPAKMFFELQSRQENQSVVLSWKNSPNSTVQKIIVYRSMDGSPLMEFAHLDADDVNKITTPGGNTATFQDNLIENNRIYQYKVQFQYTDGAFSNVSNETLIQL